MFTFALSMGSPNLDGDPTKRLFSWTNPLQVVRLFARVGNRAEAQPSQGVVLLLPDLFGSFLFPARGVCARKSGGAAHLPRNWTPSPRLFVKRHKKI